MRNPPIHSLVQFGHRFKDVFFLINILGPGAKKVFFIQKPVYIFHTTLYH